MNDIFFDTYSEYLRGVFKKYNLYLIDIDIFNTNLYLCPISLRFYSKDEIKHLSMDHYPPKSLGGKKLMLISEIHNNEFGSNDDIKLLNYLNEKNGINNTSIFFKKIGSEKDLIIKSNNVKVSFNSNKLDIQLNNVQLLNNVLKYSDILNWNDFEFKIQEKVTDFSDKTILRTAYFKLFKLLHYNLLFSENESNFNIPYVELINYINNEKNNYTSIIGNYSDIMNENEILLIEIDSYKYFFINVSLTLSNMEKDFKYNYTVVLPHYSYKDLESLVHLKKLIDIEKSFNYKSYVYK